MNQVQSHSKLIVPLKLTINEPLIFFLKVNMLLIHVLGQVTMLRDYVTLNYKMLNVNSTLLSKIEWSWSKSVFSLFLRAIVDLLSGKYVH